MALRHFLLTVPLSSLLLTVFFYYVVPTMGLHLEWHEMLVIIAAVNAAVTVLAILVIKDGKRRGPVK